MDNPKINKSLFTSWAVALKFLNLDNNNLENNIKQIRKLYRRCLTEGSLFYDAVTSSTGTKKNVHFALETVRKILEDIG